MAWFLEEGIDPPWIGGASISQPITLSPPQLVSYLSALAHLVKEGLALANQTKCLLFWYPPPPPPPQLVSNFQTEASLRKQESEEAKAKLVEVRKLIAKLLKSTNEVRGTGTGAGCVLHVWMCSRFWNSIVPELYIHKWQLQDDNRWWVQVSAIKALILNRILCNPCLCDTYKWGNNYGCQWSPGAVRMSLMCCSYLCWACTLEKLAIDFDVKEGHARSVLWCLLLLFCSFIRLVSGVIGWWLKSIIYNGFTSSPNRGDDGNKIAPNKMLERMFCCWFELFPPMLFGSMIFWNIFIKSVERWKWKDKWNNWCWWRFFCETVTVS